MSAKEFCKSVVNIWGSYGQTFNVLFFDWKKDISLNFFGTFLDDGAWQIKGEQRVTHFYSINARRSKKFHEKTKASNFKSFLINGPTYKQYSSTDEHLLFH